MMINIPFKSQWRDKMLSGQKSCTSRTKKYGVVGDTFEAFGATFRILDIKQYPLKFVAQSLYRREGCDSPEEFMLVWNTLHPRKGFDPEQMVYVHYFGHSALFNEIDGWAGI